MYYTVYSLLLGYESRCHGVANKPHVANLRHPYTPGQLLVAVRVRQMHHHKCKMELGKRHKSSSHVLTAANDLLLYCSQSLVNLEKAKDNTYYTFDAKNRKHNSQQFIIMHTQH